MRYEPTTDKLGILPIEHQLIVLGNGFDLECGLKSRFTDFFEEREAKLNQLPFSETWGEDLQDLALTVWDVILRLTKKNEENWCDIERLITVWTADSSANDDSVSKDGNNLVSSILSPLEQAIRLINKSPSEMVSLLGENSGYRNDCDLAVALYLRTVNNPYDTQADYLRNIYQFLLDDLHAFENAFATYLYLEEKDQHAAYTQKSVSLLRTLANDEFFPIGPTVEVHTSVLNFNYTRLGIAGVLSPDDTEVNIHGRLDSTNIIIGIDGTNLKKDSQALLFTKTYRLLALNNPDRKKLVHRNDDQEPTSLIKFYGHSLNEADYSYFQAIFDTVNLYHSQTRLIFYYKRYQIDDSGTPCSLTEAQQSMFQKVTKLLTRYGGTLDNEDHGKNLMHKLLLEGRLSVKEYRHA